MIKWSETLATGISEIDSQHQELFKRINLLLEACNEGKGKAEVGGVVVFLENYVDTHFSTEEQKMKQSNYPDYPQHKELHVGFVASMLVLKQELETGGASVNFVLRINRVVVDWLINHISKMDKKFGEYLRTGIRSQESGIRRI